MTSLSCRCRICSKYRRKLNLKNNDADIGRPEGILLGNKDNNNAAINRHRRQPTHTQTVEDVKKMALIVKESDLEELLTEEPNHKAQSLFEVLRLTWFFRIHNFSVQF